jgi:surface antigen
MGMRYAALLSATMMLGLSGAAAAQNLNFLGNSALAAMTRDDKAMATAAFRDALDHAGDGDARNWRNEQTGASGTLTVLRSYRNAQNGLDCREVSIGLKARGRDDQSRNHLCKTADGQWKFARPPMPAKP